MESVLVAAFSACGLAVRMTAWLGPDQAVVLVLAVRPALPFTPEIVDSGPGRAVPAAGAQDVGEQLDLPARGLPIIGAQSGDVPIIRRRSTACESIGNGGLAPSSAPACPTTQAPLGARCNALGGPAKTSRSADGKPRRSASSAWNRRRAAAVFLLPPASRRAARATDRSRSADLAIQLPPPLTTTAPLILQDVGEQLDLLARSRP